MQQKPIILASGSPRRREFFTQMGYNFEVIRPETEEKARPGEPPPAYVRRNAAEKAADVTSRVPADAVIVAADTIVVLDSRIMEKPRSVDDARNMLRALSGRVHQVITGYCVRDRSRIFNGEVTTNVEFKALSDAEIDAYIRSGEPMDKAGAYAIQGKASYMIRQIRGSYTNVVGLPLTTIVEILDREFHLPPPIG